MILAVDPLSGSVETPILRHILARNSRSMSAANLSTRQVQSTYGDRSHLSCSGSTDAVFDSLLPTIPPMVAPRTPPIEAPTGPNSRPPPSAKNRNGNKISTALGLDFSRELRSAISCRLSPQLSIFFELTGLPSPVSIVSTSEIIAFCGFQQLTICDILPRLKSWASRGSCVTPVDSDGWESKVSGQSASGSATKQLLVPREGLRAT